jgi:hypothetical protein
LEDLRELTERQRSALVMRELSGHSPREIAVALGTSEGAAKQTIFEARRSLFELAEGRAMACDEIRRMISDADARTLRGRRVRAHLRACPACAAFAAAISTRRGELRAVVPSLPPLVAAGLLERIVGAGATHGGGGAALLTAGTAGKAAGAGTGLGLGANALAGVAVIASATVGVTIGVNKVVSVLDHAGAARTTAPGPAPAGAAGVASPVLSRPATPSLSSHGLIIRDGHPVVDGTSSFTNVRVLPAGLHRGGSASALPGGHGERSALAGQRGADIHGHAGSPPAWGRGQRAPGAAPGRSGSAASRSGAANRPVPPRSSNSGSRGHAQAGGTVAPRAQHSRSDTAVGGRSMPHAAAGAPAPTSPSVTRKAATAGTSATAGAPAPAKPVSAHGRTGPAPTP